MEKLLIKKLTNQYDDLINLRLDALTMEPTAFGERLENAQKRSKHEWIDWINNLNNGDNRIIFLAYNEQTCIGMCGAGEKMDEPATGFIWGVYLRAEYRGLGIAEKLLTTAHDWFKSRSIHLIKAEVSTANHRAITFYKKLGYTIEKTAVVLRTDPQLLGFSIRMKI